jgi:undecaprenyl-diphosphatase
MPHTPSPPRATPAGLADDRYHSLFRPLLTGLALALLAWAFMRLSSEMLEGDTHAFDMGLLQQAQALRQRHPWVAGVMRDFSGLGSTAVLTLLTAITVGYLLLTRARLTALLLTAAVAGGALALNLLKTVFGRARPDLAFAEIIAPGLSFPSGHAGNSAIVFLTLGALLASTRSRPAERGYLLAMALLLSLLVGLSRVALGVHWATDVLAGWAFGAGWALLWLLIARSLGRSRPAAAPR